MLIKSIDLDDVSQTMKITLQDDAFGEANIEIAATDTAFPIRVSADFQLTVRPVQDRPEANDDDYTVSIGSRLRIVDPANGVLGNDRDADGDAITVVPGSVNLAAGSLDFGTLEVNPDGTFTYVADGPASDDDDDGKIDQVGQTVRFAYLISDGDLLSESPAQIEFQLQPSRFQNPIPGYPRGFTGEMPHSPDVDGDGTTSAVDALRIVNFLIRNLEGGSSVPVSQIASAPPDFLDVNGDGKVSATDALIVINVLSRVAISGGEGEAVAATANFATSNPVNMPTRNVQTVVEETSSEDPLDTVLAGGFEIEQPAAETRVDWMIDEEESAGGGDDDVDAALTDLAEDGTLGLNID